MYTGNFIKNSFLMTICALFVFNSCQQPGESHAVEKPKTKNIDDSTLQKQKNELSEMEASLKEEVKYKAAINPDSSWKIVNHKNEFSIALPDYFSNGKPAKTIERYSSSIDPGIILQIESSNRGTTASLLDNFQSRLKNGGIKYDSFADTSFVLSGESKNGLCLYKAIIKNNKMYTLSIVYPRSKKALFDKDVPIISKAFQAIR